MSGYDEVLYVMLAMIIFSTILLNANGMIHRNTLYQIEGEMEQEVIALGQEIIEEAHTKAFDQEILGKSLPPTSIPGSFTDPASLGTDGEISRRYYDDFDDYNGHSEIAQTTHGKFTIDVEVFYVDSTSLEYTASRSTFKKIEVNITSDFLRNSADEIKSYTLEFIRNYYAD